MNTFKNVLRKVRKSRKVTQAQLAKEIGVSTQTVNNYENGRTIPDNTMVQKIALALGTTTSIFYSVETGVAIDYAKTTQMVMDDYTEFLDRMYRLANDETKQRAFLLEQLNNLPTRELAEIVERNKYEPILDITRRGCEQTISERFKDPTYMDRRGAEGYLKFR